MAAGADILRETTPEINVAATDGMTLVYTDSPMGMIGMVDFTDPANPTPMGVTDSRGEPTSVGIVEPTALVRVNTSKSYTAPSGILISVDIAGEAEIAACDPGGQTDSVVIAPMAALL